MSAKSFRGVDSPINHCMWAFVEYASRVRPLVAAFESVTQAFTTGYSLMQALIEKLRGATGLDYRLYHVKHNNLALGGCATRKRYFWVASQIPFGVEHPVLTSTPTVWDAISDLEDSPLTWEAQPYRRPPSRWGSKLTNGHGFDGHMIKSSLEFQRAMDLIPNAGPWQPRETISDVARRHYVQTGTLPASWDYRRDKLIGNDFKMGFHQLTRWRTNEPARVITGGAMQLVLHPTRDRPLTHREVARIMGFPDDWVTYPLRRQSNLHMTWGKGIPVTSGRWISQWVRRAILGAPGELTGDPIGEYERLIDCTKVQVRR